MDDWLTAAHLVEESLHLTVRQSPGRGVDQEPGAARQPFSPRLLGDR
ncbi:hypothetical protein SAMN05216276_10787 [Streptosporangium subroseum]|uniref:Uncharacterized protein n=1 Tax=Streptosporangium subroseum TaxID=106412 RepID=A0A239P0J9_9ACTN|nr:hypothetical protein [Streptosporangium subroseum]SNT60512.1 hypothetical protein SAMN05216276_10787 [Streptosporangium subroseum]